MNFNNQIGSDDDEWFEGLESDEDNIEMGSAVQINDPISSLGLKAPLMVEIGTNMKNALDLLQGKEQNYILICLIQSYMLQHNLFWQLLQNP